MGQLSTRYSTLLQVKLLTGCLTKGIFLPSVLNSDSVSRKLLLSILISSTRDYR